MPYGINGSLVVLQDPTQGSSSSLNRDRNYQLSTATTMSVNDPMVFSVLWQGGITEAENPSPTRYDDTTGEGDVINIIFDVYELLDVKTSAIFPDDWKLVASVRKSRDLRNISQADPMSGGDGRQTEYGHIFTIDISEICKDLLSYSLIPLGKGTWTDFKFGGLNGGARQQDNLPKPAIGSQNNFYQTKNGSYRYIKLRMRAEIVDGEGVIQLANKDSSCYKDINSYVIILNNANDIGDNLAPAAIMGGTTELRHIGWGAAGNYARQMMTRAPNIQYHTDFARGHLVAKDVRMTDTMEQLQWIQGEASNWSIYSNSGGGNPENCAYCPTNTSDLCDRIWTEVKAYSATGAYLRTGRLFDWNNNLLPKEIINGYTAWPRYQNRPVAQNVSPVYINANIIHENSPVWDTWENGGTTYTRYKIDVDLVSPSPANALFLNDEVGYYVISTSFMTIDDGSAAAETVKDNMTEWRWYKIDRERMRITDASDQTYGGVYYTELRNDANTNVKALRYKGFQWENPTNPFIRFYWLNKMGGIDAYTVKGQQSISYTNSKQTILRPKLNPVTGSKTPYSQSSPVYPYPQGTSDPAAPLDVNPYDTYITDSLGGMDTYNGGREVLNVESNKIGVATTLPLNERKALWLRELASSPNVWIEYQNQVAWFESNAYYYRMYNRSFSDIKLSAGGLFVGGRHPNNLDYLPVIITNDSVDVYDDAQGLVTMTFEYTYAHPINTQRN
jgi:hypothetical protein